MNTAEYADEAEDNMNNDQILEKMARRSADAIRGVGKFDGGYDLSNFINYSTPANGQPGRGYYRIREHPGES
ncbi:hypothetical protein ACS0PU_012017 [Formica fusca]